MLLSGRIINKEYQKKIIMNNNNNEETDIIIVNKTDGNKKLHSIFHRFEKIKPTSVR